MNQLIYFLRECTLTRPDTRAEKSLWLSEDVAKTGRVINFNDDDSIDWIITHISSHRMTNQQLAAQNIPVM